MTGHDAPAAGETVTPTHGHAHDGWLHDGGHGDHHPSMDCLRCYANLLWHSFDAERKENALLREVAHAAWHLLDDGGEAPDEPDGFEGSKRDADRLSDALDALEASGWKAHDDS